MTFRGAPVVGTFHAYSTRAFPNHVATLLGARRRLNQLSARIAVSEAAAWTGRRWFGGEYTIVPNGVDVEAAPQGPKPPSDELRLLFVGRAEERKGLPVLLAAFQALVEHVPSRLTVVGADPEEISRRVSDPELMTHIDVLGKVSDSVLWRQLGRGRSALRAVSRRRELRHGPDRGDGRRHRAWSRRRSPDTATSSPTASTASWSRPPTRRRSAEELQLLAHEPERLAAMGEAGRRSAERYAWPRIAEQVTEVYERAIEPAPAPIWPPEEFARRTGLIRIDGGPRRTRQAPAFAGADSWTTPPAAAGASPGRPESPSRASSASA